MTITIPDIMREIRNCFPVAVMDGFWNVSGGVLSPAHGLEGSEFVALEGSMQDGVHVLTEDFILPGMLDESWHGRVWLLQPPADFLKLCIQIIDWGARQPDPGLHSESFGAYSRTMLSPSGGPLAWQDVFASALRPYRQMFSEVRI
ncbi:MAG: hypothetical protein IJ507_03485 [Clostridia bacterium]|nr:hypothetical protein [Clostridia bacterium]